MGRGLEVSEDATRPTAIGQGFHMEEKCWGSWAEETELHGRKTLTGGIFMI